MLFRSVPNVFWGIGLNYECDLIILTPSNYAKEIEIKISKADLLIDKKKKNYHNSSIFKELYFAVPEKLQEIALKEIPANAGLFVVSEKSYKNKIYYNVKEIKKARKKTIPYKWTQEERLKLASLGAMRILGLKNKLNKGKGKKNG